MTYATFVISLSAAFFAVLVAVVSWALLPIDPLVAFLIAAVVGYIAAEVLAWLYIRKNGQGRR